MSLWRSVLFVLGLALVGVPLIAAPAPHVRKPAVDLVYVVDTTGSMGGLLDGMRRAHWAICNQILSAKPTPELRVGVVAYRDKGDDYVTKISDLTDDLDAAYLTLHELTAAGGGDTPEHVNQALFDAIHKVAWSKDLQTLRVIVLIGDAAPHVDYSDDVKYAVTCQKAMERGIIINAIQCGSDTDCAMHFAEIANQGGGLYAAVAQNGGGRTVPTPLDKRLAEINTQLARDVLVSGSGPARIHNVKKVSLARKLAIEAGADRAGCLSKRGQVAKFDLLDADRGGLLHLESVQSGDLPPALRKLTEQERREHLDHVAAERTTLLLEAHGLDEKRAGYQQRNRGQHPEGFDEHVVEMVRRQAGRRMKF